MSHVCAWCILLLLLTTGRAHLVVQTNITDHHRIVGGVSANPSEIPYQVALQINGRFGCGWSLVVVGGQQVIITAAHCVERGTARLYSVVAGSQNINGGGGQVRRVTRIASHENYFIASAGGNDIAILFLARPFQLNRKVSPISLPRRGQQTTGEVVVSGWGRPSLNGSSTNILQMVLLSIVDENTCRRAYPKTNSNVFPSLLCIGDPSQGGRSPCYGDSGGPVRAVNGGYLAGIVSFGDRCNTRTAPAINTKVASFVDWIETTRPHREWI